MSPSDALTIVGFAITLGVAIVGWVWLRRADQRTLAANRLATQANEHAETANNIADRALELAESAEKRAARLEHLQIERRDVRWDPSWNREASHLTLTNIGTTDAHEVELVVDTLQQNVPRQTARAEFVRPTEALSIDLSWPVADPRQRNAQNTGSNVVITLSAHVRVQVVWKSAIGKPDIEVWDDLPVL